MSDDHLKVQEEYWNNMARCVQDEVAVNHWVDEQNRPVDKALFSEVADYLVARFLKGKERGAVLEIGCGNGLILKELSGRLSHEWKLYGCDISQEMLNKAEFKKANYICSDARNIPLEGNNFDLVYLHSVTQYFDNEDYLRAVIDEGMRLLKRGGGLCLMDVPVIWYREYMLNASIVSQAKRFIVAYANKRQGMLQRLAMLIRCNDRRRFEVIGGVKVPVPRFSGYYVDPKIFDDYANNYDRLSIEIQPFRHKPLVYRKFRFNVVLRGMK